MDVDFQISNFEYLMQLNTLAGRTYNDITQVLFWILNTVLYRVCKLFLGFDILATWTVPCLPMGSC